MATNKSVFSQLQSVGEDALERIAKSPATRSALSSAIQLKDRAGKTIAGVEGLESRLAAIEKRLSTLEGTPKPATTRARSTTAKTASKPAASKSTTAKPRSSASKPKS
jgi:hypothetical protein